MLLCSRSVACRLSRLAPRVGTGSATRRSGVLCRSERYERPPTLESESDDVVCRQALDTTCAGDYGRSNRSSRSGPACRPRSQRRRGSSRPDSVTALHRHVGLGAQRQPDVLAAEHPHRSRPPRCDRRRPAARGRSAGQARVRRTRRRRRAGTHCAACTASGSNQRNDSSASTDATRSSGTTSGNGVDALEHRDAVADLAHDGRDRDIERIRHRGEDLARCLFLAPLDLAEVAERDAGAARHLPERLAFLKAEVPQDVADFLTYQNHDGPPPSLLDLPAGWITVQHPLIPI